MYAQVVCTEIHSDEKDDKRNQYIVQESKICRFRGTFMPRKGLNSESNVTIDFLLFLSFICDFTVNLSGGQPQLY